MGLYIIKPEKMIIGKVSKRMYRPFHINDKVIIEKNLYNLLGLKLVFRGYIDDNGKSLADTIAVDKDGTIFMIGYKKSTRDNFLKRYKKQYEEIMKEQDRFIRLMKFHTKKDNVYIGNFRVIMISSAFTENEIESAKDFPVKCELYVCRMIENLLEFKKIHGATE